MYQEFCTSVFIKGTNRSTSYVPRVPHVHVQQGMGACSRVCVQHAGYVCSMQGIGPAHPLHDFMCMHVCHGCDCNAAGVLLYLYASLACT